MTDSNAPSDRDVDRAIRSWLHEDRHEDASHLAGAVLDQVDTIRQRRATWWPARRASTMNKIVGFGAAVAAVVAVSVVGINLLPSTGSGGGGPQPSPAPSVALTASPQPAPGRIPSFGQIDAGTYLLSDGQSTIRVTFPAGWETNDGTDIRKNRDQPNEVIFTLYSRDIYVWPDACATDGVPPSTGPTADDLVAALRAQQNSDVSEPVATTIGGRSGVRLVVSIPEGLDLAGCTIGTVRIWSDGRGNYLAGLGPTGTAPITIVETPTGRLVLGTGVTGEAAASDLAELQAIVDSIQVEPAP